MPRLGRIADRTPRPETQVLACPRKAVKSFKPGFIPTKFMEYLEHNQKIATCCRHPVDHDIEARKSHPNEPGPDIYIFHCTCGRKHTIFCVGGSAASIAISNLRKNMPPGPDLDAQIAHIMAEAAQDRRPFWEVR